MSINSLSPLSNGYLQSLLASQLTNTNSTSSANTVNTNSTALLAQQDNNTLSPFAQILSTLQQLQQSNPAEYQQITGEIATNLQGAAQTATSDGNTQAAANLTQLSTDFQNASQNGQLPSVQDLAKAIGGGHHHFGGHHHHVSSSSSSTDPDNDTGTTTNGTPGIATPSSGSSSGISQLLDSLTATSNTNDSVNAQQIIINALTNAGITLS
ncbi:MAG TPA: hypothetical protein VMB25_00090 [Bryobacteraceae bacterium]|nr:hypothetical protein [Bryobacteraceae bacterium]